MNNYTILHYAFICQKRMYTVYPIIHEYIKGQLQLCISYYYNVFYIEDCVHIIHIQLRATYGKDKKQHRAGVGAIAQKASRNHVIDIVHQRKSLLWISFIHWYYIFEKVQWISTKCNIYYSFMVMNSWQAYLYARTFNNRLTSVVQHNGN